MKNIKAFFKNLSKKQKIICFVASIVVIVAVFMIEELAFPRIKIKNMKEEFEISEFIETDFKLSSSLFVNKKNTVWSMNGYDFGIGKEHGGFPITLGENTLKITNGKLEKVYTFNISNNQGMAMFINDGTDEYNADYVDYDGDGINNLEEKNLGLSTYTNDTDGDGLLDNVELIMGLDPVKKDSYDEIREYKVVQDNSEDTKNYVMVSGKGNIANTFLDTAELNVGFSNDFVKSDIVNLVTSNDEKVENMTLYMKKKYSMDLDEYAIYSYDDFEGKLEKLETTVSGDYFLANTNIFNNFYFIGENAAVPTGEYTNQIMILLDNSGSMYPVDYVAQKLEKEITDYESGDYGNDVDFKRLSLMSALVDRLGNEKYEYSVYAFTGDYYDIIEKSKDLNQVKEGINSLKTEHQNFNGTEFSGAIRKYASKFSKDVFGKKYMIILTDGVDSGWFTYEVNDGRLSTYKKEGINIITIGLGQGVNSEYLMKIASGTNGKYLYASDANMLETLIEIIESGIEYQEEIKINDEEYILLADSGFLVNRDGFSFENFSSTGAGAEGGNCYGFSQLSKAIYLNQFKTSDKEIEHPWGDSVDEEYDMIEYELTPLNKERLQKGKIYDIKLNETYSTLLSDLGSREDYRYLDENGIPRINEKYKQMMYKAGYVPYVKDLTPDTIKLTINGKEKEYSKYETMGVLNSNTDWINNENEDDYQLLRLIHRFYLLQWHHRLDMEYENRYLDGQKGKKHDYEKEVEDMMREIKSGAPALISIKADVGRHSIMGTRVWKSNDQEKYKIGIYDSNFPGVECEMNLKRETSHILFAETTRYSFEYDIYDNVKWTSMMYCGEY